MCIHFWLCDFSTPTHISKSKVVTFEIVWIKLVTEKKSQNHGDINICDTVANCWRNINFFNLKATLESCLRWFFSGHSFIIGAGSLKSSAGRFSELSYPNLNLFWRTEKFRLITWEMVKFHEFEWMMKWKHEWQKKMKIKVIFGIVEYVLLNCLAL